MIEKMRKVYCVARSYDRDALIERVRELGVVHLIHVNPEEAAADEETVRTIDRFKRALQVLDSAEPSGSDHCLDPESIVSEVLRIQTRQAEKTSRLTALHRAVSELSIWGEVRLKDIDRLRNAGIALAFYSVPPEETGLITGAECVQATGTFPRGNRLVAVVSRTGDVTMPEGAEAVQLPKIDMKAVRRETAEIDAVLKKNQKRLEELANCRGVIQKKLIELEESAAYDAALGGGLRGDDLFAIQGWIPEPRWGRLAEDLAAAGVAAAVKSEEPDEGEQPPTLIRYANWVKPIKGLFDILGTLPGYREFDLSAFFMVTMPLFGAIIIGDAGYGLVFVLAALLLRKRTQGTSDAVKMQLLLIMGIMTFVWGMISGSFFGLGPVDFLRQGGMWEGIGTAFNSIAVFGGIAAEKIPTPQELQVLSAAKVAELWDGLSDEALDTLRNALIMTSFIIAVVHLLSARLREALALAPGQKAIASLGWALCLIGMFGIIWFLFELPGADDVPNWFHVCAGVVGIGFVVAVLFSYPHRNPLKRLGIGLAASLLPFMSTFSDTMSYIRLMAVSMASVYIALVFNMLGSQLAGASTWLLGAPVVVLGHSLNICLCIIAIFAHGVRLNMLEFSNNAGVQWGGYPFEPFARKKMKES